MRLPSHRSPEARVALSALLVLIASLGLPSPADAQESARGAELLRDVEDGQRKCDDLEKADFEAMGDSVMGRMVGSDQGHESMDALMRSMMGRTGGQQMHAALGERFSGCGHGRLPARTAGMMDGAGGMMGMMDGIGGDRTSYEDDDHHVGAGWMILTILLLIGGVTAVVFLVTRPRRSDLAPSELLAQRFARGEIGTQEYEERRDLLGGSR